MAPVCSQVRGRPLEVLGMGTQISGVSVKSWAREWSVMALLSDDEIVREEDWERLESFKLTENRYCRFA